MAEDNKAVARKALDEIFNKGNIGFIDEYTAPEFRGFQPLVGAIDRNGLKGIVQLYRSAFPDMVMRIDEVIGEGDAVVVRWTATATHRGEFLGLEPTNRRVQVSGVGVSHFSGGKEVENFTMWDALGLLQQLGVAPTEREAQPASETAPEARH